MFSTQFWIFFGLFSVLHMVANILLTREILSWVLELKTRVALITFVWCIPVIGAVYSFTKLGRDYHDSSSDNSSMISSGLIGMDEIFNPGTKYINEAKQEEYGEVREDDEPYKEKSLEEGIIIKNPK